ncbi:efflux RND transporter periplasmic adaptor subunit [Paucihalobacter ruber]|uniref:Efflux RND transporter periplasmic adaptor subunit n=1 Tax=Paucihalobacter ruber TaxID=2567861 RepID=A0A506PDI1_9FLAO|nr:efflux RND transporter periplasmic adaptor subunit [Paucihalobacter ruber]TPV31896.1 efflux RND transporter periplasmic adaptor subunit [Paucihalobacter ruber]
MKTIKIKSVYLVISILISGLIACEEQKYVETQSEPEDSNLITVTKEQFIRNNMSIGIAVEKKFPFEVQVTGMIDVPPQNKAIVNAIMGGYVKKTPLLVGNKVKKGDFLISIENPEFLKIQQNYLEIKSQLGFLDMEYQRQKQLFEENITSQKNYLKAESDFNTAKATLTGLRKQLEMLNFSVSQIEKGQMSAVTNIYAPISGMISKMNVAMGSFVADATSILEIVDTEHIHLELNVFEKDILKVKKGQTIQFKIPEASDELFEAEVYLVGASIEANRTIKVHGHLKNEEGHNFLPGMFVEAYIESDTKTASALPESAVVEIEDEFFVLKLISETDQAYVFEKQPVTIGTSNEGYMEIISELQEAQQYLTNGAFDIIK